MKKKRDAFFVMLCIGITLLFCFLLNPAEVFTSIYKMLQAYFSLEIPFQLTIIQSFIWVIILYLFMRYMQTSIYIERQYKYIEKIETEISRCFEVNFDRESCSYENNYPLVLNIIHIIYVWIFPILSSLIIALKIYFEIRQNTVIISLIFDIIIAGMIILLNIFYLVFLHKK
jgi:hypothetical protein